MTHCNELVMDIVYVKRFLFRKLIHSMLFVNICDLYLDFFIFINIFQNDNF